LDEYEDAVRDGDGDFDKKSRSTDALKKDIAEERGLLDAAIVFPS
jgi:hypothetical protein